MRIPETLLDDIRARLPLSEVVGRRVTWDRRKSQPARGDFWACCPFHQEKSPSFHVDDRKGFYHCFGCGASGDHVRFVMETEGASFPEAVERLAADAGVPMPARDAASERREAQRQGLGEVVELAAQFFEASFRGPAGQGARDYARRRGLAAETLRTFRFGLAPAERDALKRHLLAKGVDEALMVEAGLVIRPDDGRPAYDRFRNRLIIPIHDPRGRVVAFGGRALERDQDPKYLNSPETPLFQKRALLFNAHRAREAARTAGSIVVVEGYLDAIAVYQAGIKAVVATLGTAFTEDQVLSLWRLAPEPVICFDGDRAGVAAAHRAVDRILPLVEAGRSFNFAFLPDGKDPDELIAMGGPDRFLAEVKAAVPLVEVMFEREAAGVRLDTPERRAALEKRLDDLVAQIRDQRVARGYRVAIRLRLSELFDRASSQFRPAGRGDRGRRRDGGAAPPFVRVTMTAPPTEPTRVERLVLGLLVEYPRLILLLGERIAAAPLRSEAHRRFRDALVAIAHEGEATGLDERLAGLDGPLLHLLRDVHGGTDGRGRRAGERLREAFGLVAFHPSEDFIERYVVHLLDRLDLLAIGDDLEAAVAHAGAEPDEAAWHRVVALKHELQAGEETWTQAARALADEARSIRAAYGTASAETMAP
jgi:DNA primase